MSVELVVIPAESADLLFNSFPLWKIENIIFIVNYTGYEEVRSLLCTTYW